MSNNLRPAFSGLLIAIAMSVSSFGQDTFRAESLDRYPIARTQVVHVSEVSWQPLNPARGDKAPKAGTLWGDQTKPGKSGFLVKFLDGFSSPPHIHNITYRGVVISGGLHNDDPDAEPMWMPVTSYWTQPAGEVHVTAARGSSVAYVEIQEGPYLVMPPEKAFGNQERPLNVDASNIVWLTASESEWIDEASFNSSASAPAIAYLWQIASQENDDTPPVSCSLVRLPAGFEGTFVNEQGAFRSVVIQGDVSLEGHDVQGPETLSPGAYFGFEGKAFQTVSASKDAVVYVRSEGPFRIVR
ncbi:DUF4437 domain-containing protein [Rhodopirellula halodulae]|uniref:DUF4437 domain-containing protein n=1 Tax=Rhodopirellula halodulae TaxID=2894198 RepID=UPI001E286D35|nr:DUF4437 domain-containing protein [Rhodopirellula sp. JC737]MCC9655753.1 DUF4437 domain-containing protein [Rhodopirellula sp. JC737]